MPPLGMPLTNVKFTFNTAGVAGLLGSKEAISATATVHLYAGRRWLGWYNSPASHSVARHFGRVARWCLWRVIFPGPRDSLAVLLGLDGEQGPKFVTFLSGRMLDTQYLGHLTMKRSKEMKPEEIPGPRETTSSFVAYLSLSMAPTDDSAVLVVKQLPLRKRAFICPLIPITTSAVTCIMCALSYDWGSFAAILIGILAGGYASLVIGNGKLVIKCGKRPERPGHGILMEKNEVMVIKGREQDIRAITEGRFDIQMDPDQGEEETVPNHTDIGICSLFLFLQSIAQLLLVSQGTLFGQIMFLLSVAVSWWYNAYLSSLEVEEVQTKILFDELGNPQIQRFRTYTWTTNTVFACLLLLHGEMLSSSEEDHERLDRILRACIQNDAPAWQRWREKVIQQLLDTNKGSKELTHLEDAEEKDELSDNGVLLRYLLEDARVAFEKYFEIRNKL